MKPITPKSVLSDDKSTGEFNGVVVRKGTIKAFIENIKLLESSTGLLQERELILNKLKELAPQLVALELDCYVVWKNPEIQKIVDDAASDKKS